MSDKRSQAQALPKVPSSDEPLPPTRPDGAVNAVSPGADAGTLKTMELSHRPTELDRGTSLKRVTLISPKDRDAPTSRASEAYLGCLIDERYQVESIIGEGGMGVVYLARHRVIDKLVAVKILLAAHATDDEMVERFLTEAKTASSIGNKHIVDVHDFGQLPDTSTYFVMEYLEGTSLGRLIRKHAPLPVHRALDIAHQLTEALGAAHDADIVHRDLKPDNVILISTKERDDFVKVLDFGIAKVARGQNKLTRAGTIFGTPHYMSPEQASGTEVDHRSDIYALGVIMFEMASGIAPFDAENPMGLMTQHLFSMVVPPSRREPKHDLPIAFEAVLVKCLAKKPEHRYQSMGALRRDLEQLQNGDEPGAIADILASPDDFKVDGDWMRDLRASSGHSRRNRVLWIASSLVVGAAIGVLLLNPSALTGTEAQPSTTAQATMQRKPPPPPPPEPAPRRVAAPSVMKKVGILVSPIDAEITNGTWRRKMPLTLEIPEGQKQVITFEREGYVPATRTIDGSRSVITVYLDPIPGVTPNEPVPTQPLPSEVDLDAGVVRVETDAGAEPEPRDAAAPAPAPVPDAAAEAAAPKPTPKPSSDAGRRSSPPAEAGSPPAPQPAPAPAPAPSSSG